MKKLLYALALAATLTGCGVAGTGETSPTDLEIAEQAYADGRYARAQHIADTLVVGTRFSSLDVEQLCRLSMLLMDLGERDSDEGANTAMATRCLRTALQRNADSTYAYISTLDAEDRSQAMILTTLIESANRNVNPDSLYIPADSIPDNEL